MSGSKTSTTKPEQRSSAERRRAKLPGLAGMSADELTARANAMFGDVTPETIAARIRALGLR